MSTSTSSRQEWMALLALADEASLQSAWEKLGDRPEYQLVRGPETGLVMVRGRAGNTGVRFNLGEMTVTRCSVSLLAGIVGHAWTLGCGHGHARLAAVFDALLQVPERMDELQRVLIGPLRAARDEYLVRRRAEVEPTRVDFFTLVRGDE